MNAVIEKATTKSSETPMRLDESVAKNLFFGEILEENLFPYPSMNPRDQEMLGAIVDSIDGFLEAHQSQFNDWDVAAHQPAEFIQGLRDMGLFGLIIPEEFGGMALSNAAYARVLSQTSKFDSSVSLTIGAHSSIGMKGLLLWANDEQKARYLPKLASGEMIAAFCLTESGAGSDAASIKTTAKKNADGSWTLSGEKIWITNGGIADLFTVFARTDEGEGKMTAFIVEANCKGVSHGPHEDKMGIRASSTTTVAFADAIVPAANVLGPIGKGFKVAMSILNNGRTGLGGGAVGGMKTLIKLATQQALDRKQFGRPIAEFGMIREKIAQMTLDCFAAESVVWMVAHYIDSGVEDYSIEAAISKVFASDAIQRCAHEALQIAAGNGFMREYPYEKITRDSRILSIFEGTNEILRLYIALSGMKDVGASLSELKSAVGDIFSNPIKGFGVLSGYAERRFKAATGLGSDRIQTKLHPRLVPGAESYAKYTQELSKASDALLRLHGKAIADFQYQQRRLADVAIDLFVGLCVHARAHRIAIEQPEAADETLRLAEVFASQAKRRMARNIRSLLNNDDEQIEAIADAAFKRGSYTWDVI
jgi:acyl-CoA dehydrogenase family member 9